MTIAAPPQVSGAVADKGTLHHFLPHLHMCLRQALQDVGIKSLMVCSPSALLPPLLTPPLPSPPLSLSLSFVSILPSSSLPRADVSFGAHAGIAPRLGSRLRQVRKAHRRCAGLPLRTYVFVRCYRALTGVTAAQMEGRVHTVQHVQSTGFGAPS
eukprot:3892294-Rhodomonas_salina.1